MRPVVVLGLCLVSLRASLPEGSVAMDELGNVQLTPVDGGSWANTPCITCGDVSSVSVLVTCSTATGNVALNYGAAVSAIVAEISRIGGYLAIYHNPAISSACFPSLTVVGGYLYMNYNSALTLASFPTLTLVAQSFQLYSNPALRVAHFQMVTIVRSSVTICLNAPSFVYPANVAFAGHAYGTNQCALAQGAGFCPATYSTCPSLTGL